MYVCVHARVCVYVCVGEGNGGQRIFLCVCVRVCVGKAESGVCACVCVCVCVLGRDMKDGERVFQRQNLREIAWERKRYFGLILFSNHHN